MDEGDTFPYKRLRVPGIVQAVLGTLCLLCGGGILTIFFVAGFQPQIELKSFNFTFPTLPLATVPIAAGAWFIVSGTVGACASSPKCLRWSFLLLSIVGAIIVAPVLILDCAVFILIFLSPMLQAQNPYYVAFWVLYALTAFFAIIKFFTAIVSASICCCCVKTEERGQAYAMVPSNA